MSTDPAAGADPAVAVWRSAMLGASETFVRNQGDALSRWRPVYLGATKTESPVARDTDLIAYPSETDKRAFLRLRLTGGSPRLRRMLDETGASLVHAHFGGDGWLISGAARSLRLPLLVTVHGHDVTRQPASGGLHGIRYRRNLRTVFERASLIVAVSQVIRDRAVSWGADPAKVRVHYTGVPIPPSMPRIPAEWDVAFVGRFVEKKGADDLLAALAALGPARFRAVFIGDGPLLPTLQEYARSRRLDATFPGMIPPAEVTRILSASRLLAAPSKTARDGDTEGLPTTILEAMALGLPVVATRHSGIPEAVHDGETGLLVPEADHLALAAAINLLLGGGELRDRMGRRGRARAESTFDIATQTGRLEDLYDEIAAGALASR